MDVEKEGKPGSEIVDGEASLDCSLNVSQPIRQSERHLLNGGAPGFPDVIAADGNRVPFGHFLFAELENIRRNLQRGGPGGKI